MISDVEDMRTANRLAQLTGPCFVEFVSVESDGRAKVRDAMGFEFSLDLVESAVLPGTQWRTGDRLLAVLGSEFGCVLGRVGAFAAPAPPPPALPAATVIESAETLTLRCGQASIDLRADGKVLIKGDDVLVRAKGTQRIRAGTVSIN